MKLNYKRTFLIGLAFMSICAFWQLYDNIIPLILRDTFHIGDTVAGVIMAVDNVLALFLLPILGAFSDKVDTRIGRRMPFILIGTAAASVLMCLLPVIDNRYSANPHTALFVLFICILAALLIAMGIYRSPAVALMPDLTPKPLRSQGNAIINLMGAVGGILYLLITTFMYTEKNTKGLEHTNYFPLFAIVALIMIVSIAVLFFTIKEKKIYAEVKAYEDQHPEDKLEIVEESGKTVLPKPVKRSLGFILASIALWFVGYNAVVTAFSKYATREWEMALGSANLCLTIAMVGAIISYIPIGFLAAKIGRKRSILMGITLLSLCFFTAFLYTQFTDSFSPVLYVVFALVGFAWAAINVNSLPMVVEMCSGKDVGKFTGLYYTFSMSAQIITPIVSGALLEYVGYWTLFPYGALFVALSALTMLNVKHGDNKPKPKEKKLEMLDVGD